MQILGAKENTPATCVTHTWMTVCVTHVQNNILLCTPKVWCLAIDVYLKGLIKAGAAWEAMCVCLSLFLCVWVGVVHTFMCHGVCVEVRERLPFYILCCYHCICQALQVFLHLCFPCYQRSTGKGVFLSYLGIFFSFLFFETGLLCCFGSFLELTL